MRMSDEDLEICYRWVRDRCYEGLHLTDQDLENMTSMFASLNRAHDAMLLLKDLRDHYEGLGKYASSAERGPQESGTDAATSHVDARSKQKDTDNS